MLSDKELSSFSQSMAQNIPYLTRCHIRGDNQSITGECETITSCIFGKLCSPDRQKKKLFFSFLRQTLLGHLGL